MDTDLALVHQGSAAGLMAFGELDDAAFDRQVSVIARAVQRVETLKATLLEKDADYGVIPGTAKPSLYLAGAQKLAFVMRLVPMFDCERIIGDNMTTPALSYVVKCSLRLGSETGPVVAQGVGSANSWEKKYRYRMGERVCPVCDKPAIRRSKFPPKSDPKGEPGWYCFAKVGGCNTQFPADDPKIVAQQIGQVDNPDPYDTDNTLLKMGKKRAYVDGVLTATASSATFTQDVEDLAESEVRTRERDRLTHDFANILRENAVTKIKDMLTVMSELMGREVRDYRELERLSIMDLRLLVAAARVKYNVEPPAEIVVPAEADTEGGD